MIPFRKSRGRASAARPAIWVAAAALLVAGCGDATTPIQDVRDRSARYDYIPRNAQQRFDLNRGRGGSGNPHGNNPHGGAEEPELAWDLPEGWTEAPKTQHRVANFRIGESTECYLTMLPGGGGGLVANVNRWRQQMGMEAQEPGEILKLKTSKIGPYDAQIVDLEGTFTGMGGGAGKEGYRMLGLIHVAPSAAVVLKMVGPKSEVDLQRGAFFRIAKSFRARARGKNPHGPNGPNPHGPNPHGPGGVPTGSPKFKYATPNGWKAAAPSQYRDINFKIGDDVQCYLSVLVGGGGGIAPNVNRWRRQMGQAPLSAAELANLQKVRLFGEESPLIEVMGGDYSGMDGRKINKAALLATLAIHRGSLITIKMTGPTDSVKAQRDKFIEFCQSLEAAK